MWRLRLEEMQSVDESRHYHHHHRQRQSSPMCEVRQQERLGRRRMSISDLRSERLETGGYRRLNSLPRLFSRLVTSFSQSLAFLSTSEVPSTSTSEAHHVSSLDDEVD